MGRAKYAIIYEAFPDENGRKITDITFGSSLEKCQSTSVAFSDDDTFRIYVVEIKSMMERSRKFENIEIEKGEE